jgi:hypothetical protein
MVFIENKGDEKLVEKLLTYLCRVSVFIQKMKQLIFRSIYEKVKFNCNLFFCFHYFCIFIFHLKYNNDERTYFFFIIHDSN